MEYPIEGDNYMEPIPSDIMVQFDAVLVRKAVHSSLHGDYRKWLRYFLDYRLKYPLPEQRSEQVRLFIEKLRSKGETGRALHCAAHALSLFFPLDSARSGTAVQRAIKRPRFGAREISPAISGRLPAQEGLPVAGSGCPVNDAARKQPINKGGKKFNEWWSLNKTRSPEWDEVVIDKLAGEIKTRHYSRKTLKAYAGWSRKFQIYLKDKPPDSLSAVDVKVYLTHLAVEKNVSASTQNQAFNVYVNMFTAKALGTRGRL
jgi:hypothetical protein